MTPTQPTITRIWLNGREFNRVRWTADREIPRPVIVTWAVWERINPAVMNATFMGRREV